MTRGDATGHSHGHAHGHSHGAGASRARLAAAFGITVGILVAEVVGAWVTGSLALLVDAAHMLTDAGGLLLALTAASLALRPASGRRTWGFQRAEVLAAGAQATILLGVGLYAFVEGARRLGEPADVPPRELLVFGAIGLVGNLVSMRILAGGGDSSLNMRAAAAEVAADALGSVAVIVSALVVMWTGWAAADAVAGMLIALLIVPRAWLILREAGDVLLEAAPPGLDIEAVRDHILAQEHVRDVHDLHVSRITTGLPVLTAHVVIEESCFRDGHSAEILLELQQCVAGHFAISVEHSTFQLEPVGHAEIEPHAH
ncbi:cation diffusion facilitator family transporter [Falsarthrobacter nasiphocae]|uniref:Cobalt-zinc-cadmium efflux system protein n=1 Tax=Falsarthrobacter nasiphocae TaxID=189863 RepID=A0AAE4C6L7_9MICC|nr:cation diffusion facilitator family transporter [Falsarthrobacter nasiphocae]MDR6892297.1 cobalt-zinc-cadmium efflux system protein [Falsarthrobacter nasiphocae]